MFIYHLFLSIFVTLKPQGKFLGVILDEKLCFTENFDHVTNKVSKFIRILTTQSELVIKFLNTGIHCLPV